MNPPPADLAIQIRKMQLEDLDRVVEIDHASFSLPWPRSSFVFELKENEASRCWVAEVVDPNGQPILAGLLVTWLIVDELHIATIATAAEFRRHHIGRRLMVHGLSEAMQEGAVVSYLEVRRSNIAAQTLYTRLGYQEDAIRPRYYQDNNEDAILMSLQPINPALFDLRG
ncbi:MAG: ribosomal protein S18-alanine N-acetyltransferase [Anaerolineaceae bacterium]|nr:ribosomal protein S18-alanine N-acetyltransferase [Anaerolineaceae bacterium]